MGKYDEGGCRNREKRGIGAVHKQIEAWGLTMPPVDPICLHFGLNVFPSGRD